MSVGSLRFRALRSRPRNPILLPWSARGPRAKPKAPTVGHLQADLCPGQG